MLGEAIIREFRRWINVAEIDGSANFWLDMNCSIAKVGVASTFWDGAVNEHEKVSRRYEIGKWQKSRKVSLTNT